MFSNNPTLAKMGMVIIAIGVAIAAYTFYSLQGTLSTEGKVVSIETTTTSRSGGSYSTSYTPLIAFSDSLGEQHQKPTNFSASDYNFSVGTKLKIYYDPNDLSSVRIASITSIWRLPLLFLGLGAFLLWLATRETVESLAAKQAFDSSPETSNGTTQPYSAEMLEHGVNQETHQTETENHEVSDIPLPRGIEINFHDEYIQITRTWFSLFKLIGIILSAIVFNFVVINKGMLGVVMSDAALPPKAFSLLFIIIGITLIYLALVIWINKSQIYVSKKAIEIKHQPLPWLGNKRIETSNIKQFFVKKKVGSERNGTRTVSFHVMGVTDNDKTFKLITGLKSSNQALYIEQEIEKYLGIENETVSGEM